jgi:hypothetical protein
MRTKLIDSRKIIPALSPSQGEVFDLTRRAFVWRFGIASGAGLIGLTSTYAIPAQAGGLIEAGLGALKLARELWDLLEPTEGHIVINNYYYTTREGPLIYRVTGPRGEESMKFFSYSVPGNHQNIYEFDDGPCGTSVGRKQMTATSARSQSSATMVVDA